MSDPGKTLDLASGLNESRSRWKRSAVLSTATAPTVDAHLVARIASGDREAVGLLYDRCAPELFPIALRILGNSADAEDVVHDAFVTLPERARHYAAERGSVAAWLIILVRNLSIDRTRRRGVRHALAVQVADDVAIQGPSPLTPEASADTASAREQIRRALAMLPEAQRQTLLTAFFEGLSYPEIATRDGVSLGTVKSRAARALAALRETLLVAGITAGDVGDGP